MSELNLELKPETKGLIANLALATGTFFIGLSVLAILEYQAYIYLQTGNELFGVGKNEIVSQLTQHSPQVLDFIKKAYEPTSGEDMGYVSASAILGSLFVMTSELFRRK